MNEDADNGIEGHGNPQDERRAELAAQADEARAADPDFVELPDDGPEQQQDVSAPAEEPGEQETHAIKINGEEERHSIEELRMLAQKAAGADRKFEEAARLRKEAERLREEAEARVREAEGRGEEREEAQPPVEDEAVALARELQLLDEDQAAQRIRELRSRMVTPDQFNSAVTAQARVLASRDQFVRDFADLAADPMALELVCSLEENAVKAGDKRPPEIRYREIGERVRAWLKSKAPQPQAAAIRELKIERKGVHSAQRVQAANVRQAPPEDEDGEESPAETIAKMAEARGQGVVRRGTSNA